MHKIGRFLFTLLTFSIEVDLETTKHRYRTLARTTIATIIADMEGQDENVWLLNTA